MKARGVDRWYWWHETPPGGSRRSRIPYRRLSWQTVEAFQFVFEVLEVVCIEGLGQELFDDRQEVVQRSDGRLWRQCRVARASSGCSERECSRDDFWWDAVLVELNGQTPVLAAGMSEGSGSAAVAIQDLLDVVSPS
jgi:hypothetical protein